MKKISILTVALILVISFMVTGCGKKPLMDQPDREGKYNYENNELGFGLVLPEEFIYYQTQRKSDDGFIDIEVFVPSSDTDQHLDVSGYAKSIIVRIFEKESYQENDNFQKVGENNEKIYTVGFWQDVPEDWKDKWSKDLEDFLISNIEIK